MSTKLKDADLNDIESDEDIYEVEEILQKKKFGAKWKYEVKWVGYGLNETTWEPPENLANVQYMVESFEKDWIALPKKKSGRKSIKKSANSKNLSFSTSLEVSKENLPIQKPLKSKQENQKENEEDPPKQQMLLKKRKLNEEEEEKHLMMDAPQEIKTITAKSFCNLINTSQIQDSAFMPDSSQYSQKSPHLKELNENVINSGATINNNKQFHAMNEEAIIIGDDENYQPKIYGSFESKDVPKRLITARLIGANNDVNCLVEWMTRDNGIKPSDSFISNKVLREKCPNLLLDFYESRLRFPSNPSKK